MTRSAGGTTWFASCITVAGTALWRSFAERIARCAFRTRSAGSGSSVGIGTSIAETRFPYVPTSSAVLTETGTIATIGSSGSSPLRLSQERSAPAQIATTTSLTVTPKWFLIRLISSSDWRQSATRRWGVIRRLIGLGGACSSRPSSTPPSRVRGRRRASRRLAAARVGTPGTLRIVGTSSRCGNTRGTARSARTGWRGTPTSPRASIRSWDGISSLGSGVAGASGAGGWGSASSMMPEKLGDRGAVNGGMVDLRQHRDAPVLEAMDQVELPERPGAIERPRDDPRHLLGEHPAIAGFG